MPMAYFTSVAVFAHKSSDIQIKNTLVVKKVQGQLEAAV